MTDIVAAWTDQGWCDACKTNIEARPHEPGCPIAEIEHLRMDRDDYKQLYADALRDYVLKRDEVDRLRAALERIECESVIDASLEGLDDHVILLRHIARAALEGK